MVSYFCLAYDSEVSRSLAAHVESGNRHFVFDANIASRFGGKPGEQAASAYSKPLLSPFSLLLKPVLADCKCI